MVWGLSCLFLTAFCNLLCHTKTSCGPGCTLRWFHLTLETAALKAQSASLNLEIFINSPLLLQLLTAALCWGKWAPPWSGESIALTSPSLNRVGAKSVWSYNQDMTGQGREKRKINSTNIITLAQTPNPFELHSQPGISLLKQVVEKQRIYFSLAVRLCSSLIKMLFLLSKEWKRNFMGSWYFCFNNEICINPILLIKSKEALRVPWISSIQVATAAQISSVSQLLIVVLCACFTTNKRALY